MVIGIVEANYTCKFCKGKRRWNNKERYCATCYNSSGMNLNFEKRKVQLVNQAKRMARLNGREFTVTVEDIDWVKFCPILGWELDYYSMGGRKQNTASFDRKDSSQGYVKGNVFIISNRANSIKSDMSIEQLNRLLQYVENEKEDCQKGNSESQSQGNS